MCYIKEDTFYAIILLLTINKLLLVKYISSYSLAI